MNFQIGAVLERDSSFIANLGLSQLRIVHNADFPWVILVPRLVGISEITDLANDDYRMLCAEVRLVAKVMELLFEPDKLNIATLGNKVRQMHYHIVARYEQDKCFPDLVWGREFTQYTQQDLEDRIENIKNLLGLQK